jgi:hypothetical protein
MLGQREEGTSVREAVRAHDGRSLGSLFVELTRETSALVRAEIALARLEIEEKLSQMQEGVGRMAAGGAVVFAGTLTLIACMVLALSIVWPAWLAALVVGAAVTCAGAYLLARGRQQIKQRGLRPERTISSLRDVKAVAKEQVS